MLLRRQVSGPTSCRESTDAQGGATGGQLAWNRGQLHGGDAPDVTLASGTTTLG